MEGHKHVKTVPATLALALYQDTDQALVGVRSCAACRTVKVTAVAGLWTTAPPAALLSTL